MHWVSLPQANQPDWKTTTSALLVKKMRSSFFEVKCANRECYTCSCNRWLWILNVAEREKDEQWHWTGLEIEDPIVCPTNYQLQCCQSLFRTRQPHQGIVTSEVHQCHICHWPFQCSWFAVVSFMVIIGCFAIFVENQGLTTFYLQKSCHLLNVTIVFTTSSNFSSLTPSQTQLNFYTHPNPFQCKIFNNHLMSRRPLAGPVPWVPLL